MSPKRLPLLIVILTAIGIALTLSVAQLAKKEECLLVGNSKCFHDISRREARNYLEISLLRPDVRGRSYQTSIRDCTITLRMQVLDGCTGGKSGIREGARHLSLGSFDYDRTEVDYRHIKLWYDEKSFRRSLEIKKELRALEAKMSAHHDDQQAASEATAKRFLNLYPTSTLPNFEAWTFCTGNRKINVNPAPFENIFLESTDNTRPSTILAEYAREYCIAK